MAGTDSLSGVGLALSGLQTEAILHEWRFGQPQAERLAGALLHLEEFEDVDPQHPLGGPDGLKDVLCRRNGRLWVAAAYFPPTTPSFKDIKAKFEHDVAGVTKNSAEGFCFFVNQRLTIGEREELISVSTTPHTEVYHLERLVGLLNAPKGCGLRLEYLRIPMSEEEQWAFWSTMNADIVRRLADNERRRDRQIDDLGAKIDLILVRTNALHAQLTAAPSSLSAFVPSLDFPTVSMSASTLCWLHRVLTEELGVVEAVRGRFRAVQVWIGLAGSTIDDATYHPPCPEDVPHLVDNLLDWWRAKHSQLRNADKSVVAEGLADFHHRLLAIHPFLDANGRVARCVVDQAARELLNQGVSADMTADRLSYFEALREADRGDLTLLTKQVLASLS